MEGSMEPPLVRAHAEYVARDARDHSLAIGDVLVLTKVEKNGWCRGFKVSDEAHTELLYPNSYTRPVKVKSKADPDQPEPAAQPAGALSTTKSGFERARAGLQDQIGYGTDADAGLAWTASGTTLPATKSKFDRARLGLATELREERDQEDGVEDEQPVDMSHRRVFVRAPSIESDEGQRTPHYFQVAADGTHMPYSDEDNAIIAEAEARGIESQRLSAVVLPDGQELHFEVRFGAAAISGRMSQPPPSGMIQVNLKNEYTREVIKREVTDNAPAQPVRVAGNASHRAPEGDDLSVRRSTTPPRPHTPPLASKTQPEMAVSGAQTGGLDGPSSLSLQPVLSQHEHPSANEAANVPQMPHSWEDVADALVRSGEFEWPGPEFDDGFNAIDYHCYIEGLGRGLIQAFERAFVGPSEHRVLLDSGIVHEVKLQRKKNKGIRWLVGQRSMSAASSPSGETAVRMLTARMVPVEEVSCLEMGPGGALLSKNSLTSGDGSQTNVSEACGAAILRDDKLLEPDVALEYACGTPLRVPGSGPRVVDREPEPELDSAPAIDGQQLPQRDETPSTPQRAPPVSSSEAHEFEEECQLRLSRSAIVAMVAEEEEGQLCKLSEDFVAKTRTEGMKRGKRLFETYCVVGAPTNLQQPLEELLAKWSGHEDNLKRLSQEGHARPQLLSMYPPAEEIGRADIMASFCFADKVSFGLNLVKKLPSTPKLDRTVFVMTEGQENPTPLYGCCLHTQEILATKDEMHVVAPRCYCLLSRVPCLNAHFALLECVLWHERRDRTVNTIVETVVPRGVEARVPRTAAADPGILDSEREVWSLYFNHGAECCHFICELPEDCNAYQSVKVRMPSAWRDRAHEGSSDQSDESDIICMSMVREETIVPQATEGDTHGHHHYDPERLVIHWPKGVPSLIYDQPYGGMSVELAEWSIGTVFELLEPDSFLQLVRA